MDASEHSRERIQRERALRDGLCLVADRLETAEAERHAAIAVGHQGQGSREADPGEGDPELRVVIAWLI